jgi:RNA polymerase sigma-70 factor (ECF subfamily)
MLLEKKDAIVYGAGGGIARTFAREGAAMVLRRAGRDPAAAARGLTAPGEWRLLPTRANRQPTAAGYLRAPGDTEFRAFKLDVLRIEGGRIAEITTFGTTLFPEFGLPPTL